MCTGENFKLCGLFPLFTWRLANNYYFLILTAVRPCQISELLKLEIGSQQGLQLITDCRSCLAVLPVLL